MFTKALFLVLFTALVYSTSAQDREGSRIRRSPEPAGEKVAEWWHNIENEAGAYYDKIKGAFSSIWDRLKGTDQKKQRRLRELKDQFDQLQKESAVAIASEKAKWNDEISQAEVEVAESRKRADEEVQIEIDKWADIFEQFINENAELLNSSK